MLVFILNIIEKLLIIYFSAYFLIDFILYLYSIYEFRKKINVLKQGINFERHAISIIVPAYNEEVSIVSCIKMLLEIDYTDFEIIVVNDGSGDNTLEVMMNAFGLNEKKPDYHPSLITQPIRNIYTDENNKLFLIHKENGGKADAINAGINLSSKRYVCTIDADSILDSQALKMVILPFIQNPDIFVSGGQLAASNDVVLKHNKVVSSRMPRNIWIQWQIIEYIKSFMISRIGLSRIDSLLIMSGAFSIYKKEDLNHVGGFLTEQNQHPYLKESIGLGKKTVCEDMEVVVRLWRYFKENKRKAKARFLAQPICWTEVPDSGQNLYKQRVRWHQGLAETLKIHREIAFEPKYGTIGLIAYPYYLFFELFSPVVKIITLFFIIAAGFAGTINLGWVLLLIVSVTLTTAIIMSSITVLIENWSQHQLAASRDALRYKTFGNWLWLLFMGVISDFSYAYFRTYAQFIGWIKFLRKKSDWNKFDRKGVKSE